MNKRNVAALKGLLHSAEVEHGLEVHDVPQNDRPITRMAEFLASQGVLVPSAITDEQARGMDDENRDWGPELRERLERIAKGET